MRWESVMWRAKRADYHAPLGSDAVEKPDVESEEIGLPRIAGFRCGGKA